MLERVLNRILNGWDRVRPYILLFGVVAEVGEKAVDRGWFQAAMTAILLWLVYQHGRDALLRRFRREMTHRAP